MIDSLLQIHYFQALDPLWLSLVPLILFNSFFVLTCLYYGLTYKSRTSDREIALKEHSKMLGRFLKDYWYWLMSPLERLALKLRLTPNILTFMGFLGSCMAGYIFHKGMFGLGGWFMIFSASFDMFDGRIARLTGQESKSGAYFDSVMDRFGEAAVFIGLISYYSQSWVLYVTIVALIGSMMTSYTRARGEGVGVDVKKGAMQRAERVVFLGVGSICSPIASYFVSFFYPVPVDILTVAALIIIALFTNLTAIYRMRYVINKLDPSPKANNWLARWSARL